MVKDLFKKALTKKEIETYKAALEEYGAENLPIIPLIMNANAPILKDVIVYMIDLEEHE